MSTASLLHQLLLALRRLFSLIRRPSLITWTLSTLLRRVALWWNIIRSRWRALQSKRKLRRPPSSSPPGGESKELEALRPGRDEESEDLTPVNSADATPYTIVQDGETISLADVAYSLYPYSGGIRNASRSSQSLQASITAHNLTIVTRNASRSSQNLGSEWSQSAHSEEGYTINVQPLTSDRPSFRITSPTPRRQFSTSLPEFQQNHNNIPLRPLSPCPTIEISSPGGAVQPIEFTQSQSPTPRYLESDHISPVMPEATQRYTKRATIKKKATQKTIEPLTTSFVKPLPPVGWVKHTHPEGARYFYNEEKRVYTDADIFDATLLAQANEDLETIEKFISDNHISMPENAHLVIDLTYQDDKTIETTYYYVDHDTRTVFFLDTYEADNLLVWWECPGCKTDSHLRHEIEAQYWYFVQLYPDSISLTTSLISELRDVVLHFIGDSMTSIYSTAPYTLEDLHKILTLTSNMDKNVGLQSVGATSLLTRLLYIFCHEKFHNFHGEAHARIERDTSVYGASTNQRTWLIKTASLFLFSAPDVHLRTLQKMWVDMLMHKSVWEQSVRKMNDEWQEFILFATVLLNANVAFLAIQSVDIDQDPYRSPAQISSYLSVTASVGSIILGLLLIRQNRTKNRETADDVQSFLEKRSHPWLGLETLAILYSLPYALLMWGMVSFLAAFCFMCFQNSSVTTRVIVGSFCTAIAMLVAWCVWSSWEKQPKDNAPTSPPPDSDSTASSNDKKISRSTTLPWQWIPSFFKIVTRRESYDSEQTAV